MGEEYIKVNGEININKIKSAPPRTAPILLEITMNITIKSDIRKPSSIGKNGKISLVKPYIRNIYAGTKPSHSRSSIHLLLQSLYAGDISPNITRI